MCIKASHFSPIGYTLYAAISTVIELGAVFIIVHWWLPQVGVDIPIWGLLLIMGAFLAYSIYTFIKGRGAMRKTPVVAPDIVVGSKGKVATAIDPRGYVRVKGELWKAQSTHRLEPNDEIIVVAVKGIQLVVAPVNNAEGKEERGRD